MYRLVIKTHCSAGMNGHDSGWKINSLSIFTPIGSTWDIFSIISQPWQPDLPDLLVVMTVRWMFTAAPLWSHHLTCLIQTVTLSALMGFIPHADALHSESKPHHFCGSRVFLNDAFTGPAAKQKQPFVAFWTFDKKIDRYSVKNNKVKKKSKRYVL